MPEYSVSPSQAFKQLVEAEGPGTFTYEGLSGETYIETVTSAEVIEHGGQKAIYQTIKILSDRPSVSCNLSGYQLLTLSKSWADHAQRVVVVLESWPETDRIMARGYTPGNQG